MQSEVSLIYSECVTEACKACKAGSTSSSQAEETNRIIYSCKIFIWDVSVPPLLKYNVGENPFWAEILKDLSSFLCHTYNCVMVLAIIIKQHCFTTLDKNSLKN